MRNADGITRALNDRAAWREAERKRTLFKLLSGLRHARENRVEWYVWVTEGMPRLTPEQYEAIKAERRKRRKSA